MLRDILRLCICTCMLWIAAPSAQAGPEGNLSPRDERAVPVPIDGAWTTADKATLSPEAIFARRSQVYRLESPSRYQNACFDPCDCFVDIRSAVSGTMILTRVPSIERNSRRYEVSDVNWRIEIGGSDVLVRGRGVYTWYPSLGALTVLAHRLVLDLRLGEDGPVQHFDSEIVAGASVGAFPPISITIDMNNQVCADQVFTIDATPVPESRILHYWLDRDSSYQQGCLEPCLCPIWLPIPIDGSFAMVQLPPRPDTPEVAEWGVTRMVMHPASNLSPISPPTNASAAGSGLYRITPTNTDPFHHRLLVSLETRAGGAREYDSGWVGLNPGSNALPPADLDIAIALNGFYCYDEVFSISARR